MKRIDQTKFATEGLREKIKSAHWKVTTCNGKVPEHSYITIYKFREDAELVMELIDLIEKHGYYAYFYKAKFKYLNIDNYRYWYYDDDLVNRAINDPDNPVRFVEPENMPKKNANRKYLK